MKEVKFKGKIAPRDLSYNPLNVGLKIQEEDRFNICQKSPDVRLNQWIKPFTLNKTNQSFHSIYRNQNIEVELKYKGYIAKGLHLLLTPDKTSPKLQVSVAESPWSEWIELAYMVNPKVELEVEYILSHGKVVIDFIDDPSQYSNTSQFFTDELKKKYPEGESEKHKILKQYIAAHPAKLNLSNQSVSKEEKRYPSADRVDVWFHDKNKNKIAVVEIEIEGNKECLIGCYQALKYKALEEFERKIKYKNINVEIIAFLVAYQIPKKIIEDAQRCGIVCVSISESEVNTWFLNSKKK